MAILAYTMPIWAVVLAWLSSASGRTRMQAMAIVLCVAGLGVLIYPLTAGGIPLGILLALATGVSWAAGTVYLKWARIDADPMAVAIWQIVIAFFVIGACMMIFEGRFNLVRTCRSGACHGILRASSAPASLTRCGSTIITRLPAMTASLGVLGSPVIGIVCSVLILGEVPTDADIVGFALISPRRPACCSAGA